MSARFPGAHKRILIDTCIWIYHLEQHPAFAAPAGRILEKLRQGAFQGFSSELILLELTVKPLQLARQDVADEYEVLIDDFPNFDLVPISREILLEAAALRAHYRLRTPDAIQIATGLRMGATLLVTNDDTWRKIPSLETLVLSDLIE